MLRRTFLIAGAGCACTRSSPPVDILVQGAVDRELGPLLAALENRREAQAAAWTFWEGRVGPKRVVISRTEMGPVNTVAATVFGVERYRPKLIINQGTAGAHNPDLQLWDIVLGARTVHYSAYTSEHGDANTGIRPERWKPLPHRLRIDGRQAVSFSAFTGDRAALETAASIPNPRGRVLRGTIGSAFQFNREIDLLTAVRSKYGTDSEDMESDFAHGAAVGLRTPFLAVRMISDSEYYHPAFERIAGQFCAEFVLELVRRLQPRT